MESPHSLNTFVMLLRLRSASGPEVFLRMPSPSSLYSPKSFLFINLDESTSDSVNEESNQTRKRKRNIICTTHHTL